MPITLIIREGRPDDVPAVHAALTAMAEHIGQGGHMTSTPDDLARHAFGETPAVFIAVAEAQGRFAGMCLHFPIYSTWMGGPGVYIQDLYVDPAFRGRQVGEALLRHVARLSRRRGGIYLRLSVDADNVGAQRFYRRIGIRHAEWEQVHKITGPAFLAFCDGMPIPDEGDGG